MSAVLSPLLRPARVRKIELVFWIAAAAAFFIFPSERPLAASIMVMALFALSLDLVLGYAGIVSFGHAVFFGIGAYGAALLALNGWTEPVSGALVAGLAAALLALVVGPLVIRVGGLPQIMITLAIAVIVFEAANKAVSITHGDDGIGDIKFMPLFGRFAFTAFGQTAFWYALGWLFLAFLAVRRIVSSPFGAALQGIRENAMRMRFIGSSVRTSQCVAYVISGFIAGIAGAVDCQINRFVGLDALATDRSIDGLVIIVLGGVGRLYGGLVGAPLYLLVHHLASEWNPYHWMFIVGGLLMAVMTFAPGGIAALFEGLLKRGGKAE